MGHEYEVEVHDGKGGTTKHTVTVEDEHHHANWRDIAQFFGLIAGALSIGAAAIKAAKWIKKT
jgi:hypothetical protein